jgi:transposase-like protein
VSAVARANAIAPSLLYRWRKDLAAAEGRTPKPVFLPVAIAGPALALMEAPAAQSETPAMVPSQATDTIEVILANGRVVRVGTDIDLGRLMRVIAALEAAA